MNQFFNIQRFSMLVSKHWADNKKRYTLAILAFMGLLIGWFVFTLLVDSDVPMGREMQLLTFLFSLFIVGSFYASQYFRDLGSRSKGINFLLVPASAFEKILCSILFTFVLFFVIFMGVFYVSDFLMVNVSHALMDSKEPEAKQGVINIFKAVSLPFEGGKTLNIFFFFFSIQSIFLLGSVYFEKYSFIKTVISGFVVFFVVFCFLFLVYDLMPKGGYTNAFLTTYRISTDGPNDHLVKIPEWPGQILLYFLLYGIPPFLWVVTYFRLKEKQV